MRARGWLAVGLVTATAASQLGGCGGSSTGSGTGTGTGGDAGVCSGVDCSSLDDACNAGVCNPLDGKCAALPASDGTACPTGHCTAGACTSLTCAAGTADCDGNPANGCEVTLATNPDHCGSCTTECLTPLHATETCQVGACGMQCDPGFADCDGDATTGCEANLSDPANCGSCGNACPSGQNTAAKCGSGTCQLECAAGFADCNAVTLDGCEADLSSNPLQCGNCATTCPAGNDCNAGKCTPVHRWSKKLGSTSGDAGHAIAFDGAGNVYVVGKFIGSVNFGGSTFSSANYDAFVASYDGATGAHRWSKQLGGGAADEGMAVAVDSASNVYVSGYFNGTANFGGGTVSSSGQDAFVASYVGATGAHRWSRGLGGGGTDAAAGVAVDAAGDVYLTGWFASTVNFGGGALTSDGGSDIFVASYTGASGAHRWSKAFGDFDGDGGTSIAADGQGHVVATGYYFGTTSFGGTPLTSNGGADVFLASFDTALGAHVWSKHFGGTTNDRGQAVAADAAGNAYVAGLFQNTADFGAGPIGSGGSYDGFWASYDVGGAYRWSHTTGAVDTDEARAIDVDNGNVYVAGYFGQTVDVGTGPLSSSGGSDIFLASYVASTGAARWSHRVGGGASDGSNGIAADGAGAICLTGSFESSVSFGGGELASSGAQDAYVVVFTE